MLFLPCDIDLLPIERWVYIPSFDSEWAWDSGP